MVRINDNVPMGKQITYHSFNHMIYSQLIFFHQLTINYI